MDEWFYSEFGRYGFTLSQTVYDPFNFSPFKVVMVNTPRGLRNTNIKITSELANDLHGWGIPYDHHVEALRELVRMEIRRQFPEFFDPKDFKPIEKITKFKFI